jgi:hypothetical protein
VQRSRKEKNPNKQDAIEKDFGHIAAWLATHPRGKTFDKQKEPTLAAGYRAFTDRCAECHAYEGEGGGEVGSSGPDLTGYGDANWLRLMIMSPDHPARYGTRNRMPGFRDLEGPTGAVTSQELQRTRTLLFKEIAEDDSQAEKKKKDIEEATRVVNLSDIDRELIIRWLLKDDRVVFGGAPISGPPKK